ncbi:MAG: NAD(P)-binding domain-containing protein [Bacteroidetes bacterium]|jgi:glycerol-3-phosphate dehydrogenase (NAD(P)+)|nr:NAD(P)-binding domain-containing protein [Bacteroidota bacterium]
MNISVAGGGAFGTALANALKKENQITIHTRNKQVISEINSSRKNPQYFPNKILSKAIKATDDLKSISAADFLFLCIPSNAIMDFVKQLSLNKNCIIVNGAKGFGQKGKFIPDALAEITSNRLASIKGPSFANEFIFEIPTSFTIATKDKSDFHGIKSLFRTNLAVFDYTDDIRGVELLSILKNIYAIIVGIVDAYYNSSNVRFLVFTKALNEIKKLLEIFSVQSDTIFRYAGIGDFGLTSLNDLSRNRTLGLLIGKGFFGQNPGNPIVLEGVNAIDHIYGRLEANQLTELPYFSKLHDLFNNQISVKDFVNCVIYN